MSKELEQGPAPQTDIYSSMSVPIRCEVCGGDTHTEVIGVQEYYVCSDVTCMWMRPV